MKKEVPLISIIKNNLLPYLLIVAVVYSIRFFYITKFIPSGDDIYMLAIFRQDLFAILAKFIDFSGQYRPIGHLAYYVYWPFKHFPQQIFATHILLFSLVQLIFYKIIRLSFNRFASFLFTIAIFFNPIFFYHTFTIASDVNILILLLFLLSIFFLKIEKYLFPIFLFTVSIFVKETFIVLAPIAFFSISNLSINRNNRIIAILITGLSICFYALLRFFYYVPLDSDYQFVFTFKKLIENLGNFIAWIISHPRGWQYNYYGFRNPLNYLVDFIWFTVWSVTLFSQSFKKDVLNYVLFFSLFLSFAPFIFLNRTLVFYLDLPLVILSLIFVNSVPKKYFHIMLFFIVLATIISNYLYIDRWTKYSFVGNSNLIANNFASLVKRISWNSNEDICILDHNLGTWATKHGELINFTKSNFLGDVYSFADSDTNKCSKNSVIVRNIGADYILISVP